ncbi:UNVERIFIED_CONTAM: hypothetical protein FKN15_043659 [Acipenser sinensis]
MCKQEGEQELAFPSEDMESDSSSLTVKFSLSAQLLPLIKRANAVLQVPWPTEDVAQRLCRLLHLPGCRPALPTPRPRRLGPLSLVLGLWGEQVGEKELVFLSEDMESDSSSLTVKFSLSAQLLPLIKRANAVLQVPWPTEGDEAPLLDILITPGHVFGPAVEKMLQRSHRMRESMKELVHLLPK